MQHNSGPINESYIKEYLHKNIYLKYFLFLIILIIFFFGGLFLLSGTEEGYKIAKFYNENIALISGLLSYIPLYNLWTDHFSAYAYYFKYAYELNNNFFQSPKEIIYLKKFYMEILPLFLALFFYTKYFFDLRSLFKDYYKTLKYRNLKVIDNPVKKLEEGLYTEGVDNDEYNEEQLQAILKYYHKSKHEEFNKSEVLGLIDIYKIKLKNNIKLYHNSLLKMRLKLNTQEKWDEFFEKIIEQKKQPYEYLHLFRYKNIDYSLLDKRDLKRLKAAFKWEMHFKYHNLKKKWVSREFYIDSLEKEVDHDEIYKYYYTTLLFWLNKQWTNFPMYIYTVKLDVPAEWKKLNKWTDGLNAPGKTEIIIGKKGKRLILKTVDLYYRLYMFRNYLGLECEYMTDYLKIIDEKYGI